MSGKRKCLIVHNNDVEINSAIDSNPNKANQALSVSSVSGLTPLSNISSLSMIQCSDNWKQMQQDLKLEEKQNTKRIETYVEEFLFKSLKFIPSQEMMIYSPHENSLNHLVCKALSIKIEIHQSFWSKYFRVVEKAINSARNDAVSAVKKHF